MSIFMTKVVKDRMKTTIHNMYTSIYESRESFAYFVYLPIYMPTECRDNGLLSKSICVHIMCPQNYSLLE